jgi:hypothetical protein
MRFLPWARNNDSERPAVAELVPASRELLLMKWRLCQLKSWRRATSRPHQSAQEKSLEKAGNASHGIFVGEFSRNFEWLTEVKLT